MWSICPVSYTHLDVYKRQASTVAGFLILLMVSLFMLPRKYTSSVSLYVNNLTSVSLTGDVNINDINASQKLVDTYIVILQDDDVLQQVADQLSTPMTVGELSGVISMQSVNQTEVLQISAETVSPELSACLLYTSGRSYTSVPSLKTGISSSRAVKSVRVFRFQVKFGSNISSGFNSSIISSWTQIRSAIAFPVSFSDSRYTFLK